MSDFSYIISHETTVNWLIVAALWISFAAVAASYASDAVGAFVSDKKFDFASAASLFFIAAALRLALPTAFMRENSQGIMYFSDVAAGAPMRDTYGFAQFALILPFFKAFGATFGVFLKAQALISALLAPAAYALLKRLNLGFFAAFPAAFAVALSPVLARFGASEDLFPTALLFALLSVERVAAYGASGGAARLFASAAALFAATQSRPEMYVFAPFLLCAVVVSQSGLSAQIFSRRDLKVKIAASALFALFLSVPLHNFIWKALHKEQQSAQILNLSLPDVFRYAFNFALAPNETGNVAFSGAFAPWTARFLAFAGLMGAAVKRSRPMAALFAGWALAAYLWIGVQNAPIIAARMQQFNVFFSCLFAGYGAAFLTETAFSDYSFEKTARAAAIGLICVVLAGEAGFKGRLLDPDRNPQREFVFLSESLIRLPDGATVFYPQINGPVNSFFPSGHFALDAKGIETKAVSGAGELRDARAKGKKLFYMGLFCYQFAGEKEAGGDVIRPECRDALTLCSAPYNNLEETFYNKPYDFLYVPAEKIKIGFYECVEK